HHHQVAFIQRPSCSVPGEIHLKTMSPDKSRNPGHQFVCNVTFSPSLCGQQMSHQCVSPERGLTIQSDSDTYDTLKLVGEGIYGEVTKCRKRSTGRFVALKALKHICCGSTEIRILKLLGKTDADEFHIVRLLEYFHVNARPHLVFELLDQSLLDFHKATDFAPLPVKHIRVIATQLLKALVKLKELSIIHTDLKPDNIMLVNHVQFPFRVKLIDFGSASVLTEVQHIQVFFTGALYYRSPEILLGLPFCEKMDMWSLGCVLSELRLGRPLYPGRNQYESHLFFTRHCNMVQLLKRMLSLDPKTRIAPTAALRHQFISLQQLQANHDRTEVRDALFYTLMCVSFFHRGRRTRQLAPKDKPLYSQMEPLRNIHLPSGASFPHAGEVPGSLPPQSQRWQRQDPNQLLWTVSL
uniref:Homeodomain-interacting protein kinase 4-like n=1 Tax=Callorhinchus milii TaxID=7868 RepID=A0A4W3JWY8_CALMI